jgi:DNA-directed RNA polymerase subunit omega
MIHPSYAELMKKVNNNTEAGEEPVVNSRYSIVAATAKRARQLIDGQEPLVRVKTGEKPLSTAVDELYTGELQILSDETAEEYDALEEAYNKAKAADKEAAKAVDEAGETGAKTDAKADDAQESAAETDIEDAEEEPADEMEKVEDQ